MRPGLEGTGHRQGGPSPDAHALYFIFPQTHLRCEHCAFQVGQGCEANAHRGRTHFFRERIAQCVRVTEPLALHDLDGQRRHRRAA
ncbi:hypothetical protein [Acidithiobacillus sp.]|uniref:hypothetical protein n=1 Tax=Acidithiobacillus sp. TaxID=1872118 RepID=UPI0025C3F198|nr:hypothetical protein [Acidithiobacillus sp.]MCK9188097.1 hypothetical protein [Acidithiobacillus sp.]MCK9360057.1 hypothetical protein [Acidithiobacillus sp.]